MKKNVFLKIVLMFIAIIITSFISYFSFADTETTTISYTDEKSNKDIQSEEEQKKELLKVINECIDEIKNNLKDMDDTLDSLDKTEEYDKYPAVRLNIDTPFFGLSSMIDNKLKIKNDVSTVDVANGYSIKDIVNNMSIKLPDSKMGNIVISTKDIKFNDNISIDDAKTAVLKMVQYISQVQNTNELLDKRINNIFQDYIPKEKTEKVNSLKEKLDNISSNLIDNEENLTTIYLCTGTASSQSLIDNYYDINSKIYNLKNNLKNVLIDEKELEEIEKLSIDLELEQLNYTKQVNDKYDGIKSNIDLSTLLSNTKNILDTKQKILDNYVENSELKQEYGTDENRQITQKKQYDVTSRYLVDYEKNVIDNIDQKLKYYTPSEDNKQNINSQEKDDVLKETVKLYEEYISKEDKFYLDNLNYLLKDTTYKLGKLSDYTDASTIKDIEYIYIKLPQEIEDLLNEYTTKSTLQTNALSSKLYERILIILKSNIQVNNEFSKSNES